MWGVARGDKSLRADNQTKQPHDCTAWGRVWITGGLLKILPLFQSHNFDHFDQKQQVYTPSAALTLITAQVGTRGLIRDKVKIGHCGAVAV